MHRVILIQATGSTETFTAGSSILDPRTDFSFSTPTNSGCFPDHDGPHMLHATSDQAIESPTPWSPHFSIGAQTVTDDGKHANSSPDSAAGAAEVATIATTTSSYGIGSVPVRSRSSSPRRQCHVCKVCLLVHRSQPSLSYVPGTQSGWRRRSLLPSKERERQREKEREGRGKRRRRVQEMELER